MPRCYFLQTYRERTVRRPLDEPWTTLGRPRTTLGRPLSSRAEGGWKTGGGVGKAGCRFCSGLGFSLGIGIGFFSFPWGACRPPRGRKKNILTKYPTTFHELNSMCWKVCVGKNYGKASVGEQVLDSKCSRASASCCCCQSCWSILKAHVELYQPQTF